MSKPQLQRLIGQSLDVLTLILIGSVVAKFYRSLDTFSCISNPSIKIPLSAVNDDYCDCPDGSDEPGTSACAGLSDLSYRTPTNSDLKGSNASLTLPGFYCKNKGHNPSYVPFTHVNDGVCDYELCCDGSDEWKNVGKTRCADKCKELGAEWKKHDEKRQISLTAAGKRRAELVKDAARMRLEIDDYLGTSVAEVKALEAKIGSLEKEKDEIERTERSRVVKKTATGGKAGILAGLAKNRLGEYRAALSTARGKLEESQNKVQRLETILATFKEEFNPNFNDEGVKRAVRSWEEYAATDLSASPKDEARERELDDMTNGIDAIPWEDFEGGTEVNEEIELRKLFEAAYAACTKDQTVYSIEAYLPQPLREWIDGKLRELRVMLISNGILAGGNEPASENKAVKEAEERLNSARNELTGFTRTRQDREDDLKKDYGPEDVFRPLKGQCTSLDAGEYRYELCWMDRITQHSKKGGMGQNMGTFESFDSVVVDEDITSEGKGLGSGERMTQKYANGASCWQGPNRSTTVIMACAENEEIWKVMEEEKCVYRLEVGTPAACKPPPGAAEGSVGRDEL